jgi:hypothetical protein
MGAIIHSAIPKRRCSSAIQAPTAADTYLYHIPCVPTSRPVLQVRQMGADGESEPVSAQVLVGPVVAEVRLQVSHEAQLTLRWAARNLLCQTLQLVFTLCRAQRRLYLLCSETSCKSWDNMRWLQCCLIDTQGTFLSPAHTSTSAASLFRLWDGADSVEIEWTAGPLPQALDYCVSIDSDLASGAVSQPLPEKWL